METHNAYTAPATVIILVAGVDREGWPCEAHEAVGFAVRKHVKELNCETSCFISQLRDTYAQAHEDLMAIVERCNLVPIAYAEASK